MARDGRRFYRALWALIVIVLVGGAFAVGTMVGGEDDEAGGGWSPFGGGGDGNRSDVQGRPLAQGTARSVEYDGLVTGLATVTLDIPGAALSFTGDVAGRGDGTLVVGPGRVRVAGAALDLRGTPLVVTPSSAVAHGGSLGVSGPIRVEGPNPRFRDSKGREVAISEPLSEVEVDGHDTVEIAEQATWTDPPTTLALDSGKRTTLSWVGEGSVRNHLGAGLTGARLGVKAEALTGRLERTPDNLVVTSNGALLQAYVDGQPQVPTEARVDVKHRPHRPIAAGQRGAFTWAPTNEGPFDMTMTRIRPGNDQGKWVRLALQRLPSMCGGEGCPQLGGDTGELARPEDRGFLGFGDGPDPINAVIIPDTGDERDISFTVPAGTPPGRYEIVLVVEGNFPPMTVTIPVEVA